MCVRIETHAAASVHSTRHSALARENCGKLNKKRARILKAERRGGGYLSARGEILNGASNSNTCPALRSKRI
jgi:hypothetical protein